MINANLYFKQSVISNILMLTDYLPAYSYSYDELIKCDLSNLEAIRDNMIPEYNKVVKQA